LLFEIPEFREQAIRRGKELIQFLRDNPQITHEAAIKRWERHRDKLAPIAKANLLKATEKALQSPKYWEWVRGNSTERIEGCIKGGRIAGKIASDAGFGQMWKFGRTVDMLSEAGKKGGVIHTKKVLVCPNCGYTGKSNGMYTWHFDNCNDPSREDILIGYEILIKNNSDIRYNRGCGFEELATTLELSINTLKKKFEELGLPEIISKSLIQKIKENSGNLIEMIEEGCSQMDIARKFGISSQSAGRLYNYYKNK
jgi:hypothetical protein